METTGLQPSTQSARRPSGLCQVLTLVGAQPPQPQGSAPRGMETGGSRLGVLPQAPPQPHPALCPISWPWDVPQEGIHTALEPAQNLASSPPGPLYAISVLVGSISGPVSCGAGTGAVAPLAPACSQPPVGAGPETQKGLCATVQATYITVNTSKEQRHPDTRTSSKSACIHMMKV